MPDRRTRTGVEIARVGRHLLSTGWHEFTRPQLVAAVDNAQTQTPTIGIGHTDPRFNNATHDGDPGLGRVVNLRLEEDGDLLIGDLADLPEWLDDGMDIAYPRRSLEGQCLDDDLRIGAVKLLGTKLPAIKGLADLPAVLAASGGTPTEQARKVTRLLVASTSLDDLREAYDAYANSAIAPDDPRWEQRAWVEKVNIDPDELIVHQNQKLYRVPWMVNRDGTFTFGDRTEVAVQYVDVAAVSGDAAVFTAQVIPAAHHHPKQEGPMDSKVLREKLGLAEDASEEDVAAKLSELKARPENADDLLTEEQVAERVEQAKTEAVDAERQAVAAAAGDDDNVKLDRATYDDLKAAADDGREARKKQVTDERDTFIAAAVSDGKFPPARVEHYTKRYDSDPDGTKAEIDALEKGVIPVTEIGASTSTESTELESTGLFPQLTTTEA